MTEALPKRPGRNDRCPCGSGKKYKQCCLTKDAAADSALLAEAAKNASPPAERETEANKSQPRGGRPKSADQPWKRDQQQVRGFQKRSGPRKRGAS